MEEILKYDCEQKGFLHLEKSSSLFLFDKITNQVQQLSMIKELWYSFTPTAMHLCEV